MIPHHGQETFLFPFRSRLDLGPTQPPKQRVHVAGFLGVKWLGRETDHLPLSSSEVNNIVTI
jgi:hypothetical protein